MSNIPKSKNKVIVQNKRIFMELRCLEERITSVSADKLIQDWFKGADKRSPEQCLARFINYNKDVLDFLGITVDIVGFNKSAVLEFRTSSYIGAVPLRAPDTGKPMGDLIVLPRFSSRNIQIEQFMVLLKENIRPEFFGTIPLVSDYIVRPPLYMDAAAYIHLFERVFSSGWQKFKSLKQDYVLPIGDVDWNSYSRHVANPSRALIFPCSVNTLSKVHPEFQGLKYVFDLASRVILSPEVPASLRTQINDRISFIKRHVEDVIPLDTSEFVIHASDPLVVKEAKDQANLILQQKSRQYLSWRVDIAVLFEHFMQYIIGLVARELGGKVYCNPRFPSSGRIPTWGLSYLEPDIVMKIGNNDIPLDAKYKSNMFNLTDSSQILKDTFRSDLQQLLAYASFSNERQKVGAIFYPADKFIIRKFAYRSLISDSMIEIKLFGVPFDVDAVLKTKQQIKDEIISSYNALK